MSNLKNTCINLKFKHKVSTQIISRDLFYFYQATQRKTKNQYGIVLKTQTKELMEVLENKDTSGKTAKEWILLQNIRSLTKNFDEFKIFISQTEVEPVAIYLTETWLKNCFESDCFSTELSHPTEKKRGGCVGIFVHKKATKNRIAPVDTNSLQAISLEIKFCDKTHLVTCAYIPPNATKAETFEKLSSYIDQISITPSTLHIVCGDLNVNF